MHLYHLRSQKNNRNITDKLHDPRTTIKAYWLIINHFKTIVDPCHTANTCERKEYLKFPIFLVISLQNNA